MTSNSSRRSKRKKGVSPLIATVLLIAFAVALGAVVMNWGRSYTEQTAASVKDKSDVDVKCSLGVKLKLTEYNSIPQICTGQWGANSNVTIIVENAGEKKIESLRVTIYGASAIVSNTTVSNSSISIAGATKIVVPYSYETTGTIKKITVIPVVEISGKQTPCAGSGSVLEKESADILSCNSS